MTSPGACPRCLARAWLLERLTAHLDVARGRASELLGLDDEALIAAVAGRSAAAVAAELHAFDPDAARRRHAAAGVQTICRCAAGYPAALLALAAPPATLHLLDRAGSPARRATDRARDGARTGAGLRQRHAVAIVGARRASPYSLEAARSLARDVACAGVAVVSGMAAGIDSAAHEGALEAGGATVAVLACAPERSYPATARDLRRRLVAAADAAVIAELGPGVVPRRWMFPARNRIIAALAGATVVVAARRGSGALLTAAFARELGRPVGAVPGPISAPLSWGPHRLLRDGARPVVEAGDILAMLGLSGREAAVPPVHAVASGGATVPAGLGRLLEELADGHEPAVAFAAAGLDAERGLAALTELELAGRIRRGPGGSTIVAG